MARDADRDHSGSCTLQETWQAYQEGKWNFTTPRMLACYRCIVEIARNFQQGWLAALRDTALFGQKKGRDWHIPETELDRRFFLG